MLEGPIKTPFSMDDLSDEELVKLYTDMQSMQFSKIQSREKTREDDEELKEHIQERVEKNFLDLSAVRTEIEKRIKDGHKIEPPPTMEERGM